ncbi:MAG: ComEC/Rec2 family competence protein [Sphingopyxis sp.]
MTFLARAGDGARKLAETINAWAWSERESLILWVPVAFGAGVAAWFMLPGPLAWGGFLLTMASLSMLAWACGAQHNLAARAAMVAVLAALCGCLTIWAKSLWVTAPILERPAIVAFLAKVEAVENLSARGSVRLTLAPEHAASLPPRVRVTFRDDITGIAAVHVGDAVRLRARLMPPPRAALPGGYDYARRAWFDGIGAVGTGLGPIVRGAGGATDDIGLRERLSRHIRARVDGGSGAIAAALATGDRGGMSAEDDEAMRRSGLAHLLSVSGLHVTAVVAGTMWLLLRLLALLPWVALRWPLTLIAAGGGAVAALGYTLLTGSEVPTVRSLLAAVLVLMALALGREAISLRLIAAGAMVVLLLWPETLVGPSFQLSFAAVTAIVALHSHPSVKRLLSRRDEGFGWRLLRNFTGLLVTGLAVEIVLMPIALFHFHRAGLYGALANMIAIPLTTFIIMPAEALAIVLDVAGWGAPAWWVVQVALDAMLWLAHGVANAPGSLATLPNMPVAAFGLIIIGGLWMLLWRGSARMRGGFAVAVGLAWATQVSSPDILVTSDGRHIAVRRVDGGYALLRDRAGEFVRDQLSEVAGVDAELSALDDMQGARCSPDFCVWQMEGAGPRRWTFMAARSGFQSDWRTLIAACARVDVVIADRWMPRACHPRWFKADRKLLEQTGGLAITLDPPNIIAAASPSRGMPWANPETIMPPRPLRPPAASADGAHRSTLNDSGATAPPIAPAP